MELGHSDNFVGFHQLDDEGFHHHLALGFQLLVLGALQELLVEVAVREVDQSWSAGKGFI